MKRLSFFIGLLLALNNLVAQKTVTKNYKTNGASEVFFKLRFAENIEVKNWNKNSVKVVANVNLNENKDNDKFSLEQDIVGNTLKIKSNYGNLLKKNNKQNIIVNSNCNSYNYSKNYDKIKVSYTIYVPKKIDVRVKSISGNIVVNEIKNNVKFNLVSGNIDVKKHSKNMDLSTVSGDIDVVVRDAEFRAKTVTGNVYSNLDINFNKRNKRSYSSKIYGTVANGDAKLKLKTVSGDVLLRKQ